MFRTAALVGHRQKLHGDVFLVQPLAFSLLAGLLFFTFCTALTLLLTGTYARSERVFGHLVPTMGLVKIQVLRAGTLQQIHVHEGDKVRRGQKLATILVSETGLDGRSDAESALVSLARQAFEIKTQINLETNQLEADTARLRAEKRALLVRVHLLQGQLLLHQQLSDSAEAAFRNIQQLASQGFISREQAEQRRQQWLTQKAEETLRQQELAAALAMDRQLELRLQQLPNESSQRTARLRAREAELDGKRDALSGHSAYVITSPVNGKIASMSLQNAGNSLATGQALLTIMPEDSVLKAELFVPSRAIGFVEKGQQVRLLYDAFPHQFFGAYSATITDLTESILSPSEILVPFELNEPVYRVSALIDQQQIRTSNRTIGLQSGMTLKANIIMERRAFMDWLLEPVRSVRARS